MNWTNRTLLVENLLENAIIVLYDDLLFFAQFHQSRAWLVVTINTASWTNNNGCKMKNLFLHVIYTMVINIGAQKIMSEASFCQINVPLRPLKCKKNTILMPQMHIVCTVFGIASKLISRGEVVMMACFEDSCCLCATFSAIIVNWILDCCESILVHGTRISLYQ